METKHTQGRNTNLNIISIEEFVEDVWGFNFTILETLKTLEIMTLQIHYDKENRIVQFEFFKRLSRLFVVQDTNILKELVMFCIETNGIR